MGWRNASAVWSAYCSFREPEFCCPHPGLAAHKRLWLQLQGILHEPWSCWYCTQVHISPHRQLKNKSKKCTGSFVIMQILHMPFPTEVAMTCLKIRSIFISSFLSTSLSTPTPLSYFSGKNADINDLPRSWSSWVNYSPWRISSSRVCRYFDHFHDFMTWHNVIIGWLSNKESN